MKLAVFTLNPQSRKIGKKLQNVSGHQLEIYCAEGRLSSLVTEAYEKYDGLVFITAAGIAVRMLAPLIQGKDRDPAAVVIDPLGQYVISLLSGHLGGANRLARQLAAHMQATPVITTATDVLGMQSVEEWAQRFNLKVENPGGLVKINSAVIRQEQITVYSRLHPEYFQGNILQEDICFYSLFSLRPEGHSQGTSLAVTSNPDEAINKVDLCLTIQSLTVGIGCCRGVPASDILAFIRDILTENGRRTAEIRALASVDIKSKEAGILEAARELKVPVVFFTPRELAQILKQKVSYANSKFVNKQVGVGGVCEPAAVLACQGKLIIPKQIRSKITLSVAEAVLPWWD